MGTHKSVKEKVQSIFEEKFGNRAEPLRGNVFVRENQNILGKALSEYLEPDVADELAFHLLDWNSDAAFLVAFIMFPERFTAEELRDAVDMLMIHIPAHVLAAARLGDYEATDIFINEEAT